MLQIEAYVVYILMLIHGFYDQYDSRIRMTEWVYRYGVITDVNDAFLVLYECNFIMFDDKLRWGGDVHLCILLFMPHCLFKLK